MFLKKKRNYCETIYDGATGIKQGWANSCPRAKCGPPQRFKWPADAFRKYIFKSEISLNASQLLVMAS